MDDCVFVKDCEGFVRKKLRSEVLQGEKEISEKEYLKFSGLNKYERKFGHGGKRENAGRKIKYTIPLKVQMRVTEEEKDFLKYAREHHIDYSSIILQQQH